MAGSLRNNLLGSAALTLLLAPSLAAAQALPTGGVVTAGAATINAAAQALTVTQTSARTAINWTSFNIGPGGSVIFNQPGASAIALNRVVGADPSVIQGALRANGQVFLINPNGVLFGRTRGHVGCCWCPRGPQRRGFRRREPSAGRAAAARW